jgi:hypothetical protein
LNETIGISEVSDVIVIHTKLIKMANVIGCFMIFESNLFSSINLKKNNNITPNIKGSVGIYIPMPPISNSSKLIDKGVEKIINHIKLSSLKKAINTIAKAQGIKAKK